MKRSVQESLDTFQERHGCLAFIAANLLIFFGGSGAVIAVALTWGWLDSLHPALPWSLLSAAAGAILALSWAKSH